MPPVENARPTPKQYWRSLDELADTPEFRQFVEREFPNFAPELLTSRRSFLKLMGASCALAGMTGLTGCIRWPVEKIVPYTQRPEGHMPGVESYYATSMEVAGVAQPLLVKSYDGRPLKVEGNPEHPMSRGAANAYSQASLLDMYSPQRIKGVLHRHGDAEPTPDTWEHAFSSELQAKFQSVRSTQGAALAIVHEPTSSPSFAAMRESLKSTLPRAVWCEHAPVTRRSELAGSQMVFGQPMRTIVHFDQAEVILSLDDDFLQSHPAAVHYMRDFAHGRRPHTHDDGHDHHMSQLHVVEPGVSLTGSNADHRYPVPPSQVKAVAGYVANKLVQKGLDLGGAASDLRGALGAFQALPAALQPMAPQLDRLADALYKHQEHAVVTVGSRQPAEVHALAAVLNQGLKGVGKVVSYQPEAVNTGGQTLDQLVPRIGADITTVLILGGNPVYGSSADVDMATALAKPGVTSMHLTVLPNETSDVCTWVLPEAHYLEAWGDARSWDGTYTLQQPLIAPLYDGRSALEVLSALGENTPRSSHDIVRATFRATGGSGDFETRWQQALHDGFVPTEPGNRAQPVRGGWARGLTPTAPAAVEMSLTLDTSAHDGRYYHNVWLQEMPDPVTKLTWDNAALISPKTATELGVKQTDMVKVTAGSQELSLPAFVLPGHADGVVTIPLGYRSPGSEFPINSYNQHSDGGGFNAYTLTTAASLAALAAPAQLTKAGGRYLLATTQDHHFIETIPESTEDMIDERIADLVRTRHLHGKNGHGDGHGGGHGGGDDHGGDDHAHDDHAHGGDHGHDDHGHGHHGFAPADKPNLWNTVTSKDGEQWGMVIDLSTCTGCSACVVACQAENNIGVVGKKEVTVGREMHWLRIDRYFKGEPEKPGELEYAHQPMPCQQCENAPCEQVCPVGATMHSEDGLNDMVYNRCIGTRYCSNNCPFKVRRFNYFNNFLHSDDVEAMGRNPDVTLRSRGVMEKCTFCVQRIRSVRINARNENRRIADGEVNPACAQTCPAQAITFGDLTDPDSRVSKLKSSDRNYTLLDSLNIHPRTSYLERVKNPLEEQG